MDKRTAEPLYETTADAANSLASESRARVNHYVPGGMRTVVIGIAILLVAGIVWTIRPTVNTPANRNAFLGPNQAISVGVAKAASGDIDVTINALGTVTPLATVTVNPQIDGKLIKIDFTEGQMVSAGQVLAEIDPRPYQAVLDQAQGNLARDRAQLANAQVDLKRYQTLLTQNSIAQQQVATQEALVGQLEGVVKTDEANIESAQINLDYSVIKSPIAGRVGLRQVDLGNLLTAGQVTGIAVVTQLQPISVIIAIPEDNIGAIMARVRGGATLRAEAYDRSQTTKLETGTLATVDNQIDPATGTVKMRAMFDNSRATLFPQQFVNVRLFVDTLHGQTVVPAAAIQRGEAGTFVYVVNEDRTVNMRAVNIGQTDGDRVAVTKGLTPGDMVVVDGADRLRDGAKVQVPGEEVAPVAATKRRPNGENRGRGARGGTNAG